MYVIQLISAPSITLSISRIAGQRDARARFGTDRLHALVAVLAGLYCVGLLVGEGQSGGFGGRFRLGHARAARYWARFGKVAGSGVGLLPLTSHEEFEAEIRPLHERKSAFGAHVDGTRRDRHDEDDDLTAIAPVG